MKLHIPRLKEELVLDDDWTFTLYREYRNYKLMERLNPEEATVGGAYGVYNRDRWKDYPKKVTLWVDTVLIVDRIYIRQGGAEFDSVTFRIKESDQGYQKTRFWAKLEDVNTMVIR